MHAMIAHLFRATSVRFAVVDRDPDFRNELECHAASAEGVHCVATFDSPLSTPSRLLRQLGLQVLLIDPDVPIVTLPAFVGLFRAACPNCSIVILSHDVRPCAILSALRAGADGYLLKTDGPDLILRQVVDAAAGGAPMSGPVAKAIVLHHRSLAQEAPDRHGGLSERELKVMEQLATGVRYKEAADSLGMSVNTLRTHVRSTYRKLGVNTMIEAIRKLQPIG